MKLMKIPEFIKFFLKVFIISRLVYVLSAILIGGLLGIYEVYVLKNPYIMANASINILENHPLARYSLFAIDWITKN
jgi:hypothetical protein